MDSADGMPATVRRRSPPAAPPLSIPTVPPRAPPLRAARAAPPRRSWSCVGLIRDGAPRVGHHNSKIGGRGRRDRLADVSDGRSLTLTASLRPAALDARRGIVRLHPEVLTALALKPGDPVRPTGRPEPAGIVALAETGASRALLYADDLLLGNLGLRDGGRVTVAPVPARAAHRVTLDGPPEILALVSPEMLRLALLGKVVTVHDNVSLLPQDVLPAAEARPLVAAARRSLANTVGYAWTTALLTVTDADPTGSGLVTMDTVVGWDHGAVTHSPETPLEVPTPEAPSIEDLPGLRNQA